MEPFIFYAVTTTTLGISFGLYTPINGFRMKNLSRWEIANHISTSVKETYPSDRATPAAGARGGKRTQSGEFYAREQAAPNGQLRDERSFTQSLWGRR